MQAPGFWDDQERAAQVSASTRRRRGGWRSSARSTRDIEDLEALAELAAEDDSIAAELEEQRASIETRLAELEEQRLFSRPLRRRRRGRHRQRRRRAAPTRRTGPRCCCAWRCAGPSGAA